MGALSSKLRSGEGGKIFFRCPGCGEAHGITVGDGPGPRWGYNGNPERPTFTPSILVRGSKVVRDADGNWTGEWEHDEHGNHVKFVCHSFVKDGRIQFLGDCTHALAGQTVDLPNWER